VVAEPAVKAYVSTVLGIEEHTTFNTGQNSFAAQFTAPHLRVANYIQRSGMEDDNLVVETIRTGQVQTIGLPLVVNLNAPDKSDLEVIMMEFVKTVAKR
jgi:hypothetical protein